VSLAEFRYVKVRGPPLSPESFGGREPKLRDVTERVATEVHQVTAVELFDGVHWLRKEVYEVAKEVLRFSSYEAHEGVTFTSAKGAWLIVEEPKPVEPPLGAPRDLRYVAIETELSRKLNLGPIIIEEEFVFRGFKGEDVEVGRVLRHRYFVAAYRRDGTPLSEKELEKTLLWKNYLSKPEVLNVLGGVSTFLRKKLWHLERMNKEAMSKYKVVWRDAAKKFVPAIEVSGAIPDYTVNYVAVSSFEEACYLMAVLLAPRINAVVEELSPWIGHVQPRFIKYFKIPKYDPRNNTHRQLAQIGKAIYERGEASVKEINLIDELVKVL